MNKNFFKFFVLLIALFCCLFSFGANGAVVDENSSKYIVIPDEIIKKNKPPTEADSLVFKASKNPPKMQNINVILPNDRVIADASSRISAIYPIDNPQNNYPGYRGTNQLVIYCPDFGLTTGTNEFGKEAVVVNNTVVALTGANSIIPQNGYVISGHGSAKKWINDNIKIGSKIEISNRQITAYTTLESYRYCAKCKIDEVERLVSSRSDIKNSYDKQVLIHLKRAKQKYKKSQKDNSDNAIRLALDAQNEAQIAFRYTLPYIQNELKGVWIRPVASSAAEIQKTLDKIKDSGINNIFLETFWHGKTIFPSKVMKFYGFEEQNPDFKGVDILSVWVSEAHRRNIKVHAWFESFYIGNKPPGLYPTSILSVKPDWMNRPKSKAEAEGFVSHPQEHNGYFLDPANPEVVDFLLELIDEITTSYALDGVNVDYVRYPNIMKENYDNQWGYTKFAREEFKLVYDTDPIDLSKESDLWSAWVEYRQDKITDYVKKVSYILKRKHVLFSLVIFPDYKVSVKTKFQDWAKWAQKEYPDAFTPLILTSDDTLARKMLTEIKERANKTTVYPGLFAGFIESDPEDLLRQIHILRTLDLSGVILFDWAHLSDNYLDTLKTSVFKAADIK